MNGFGLLLAVPTVLVWGVTFVNTKALLVDFSALEILFLRFVMAYAALWAFRPRVFRVGTWRQEVPYVVMGLMGVTVYQFLENCAIHWTNASNVSIIVSICPMTTALLAQFWNRERVLSWTFAIGFVLAMAGVTLVSLNGISEFHFRPAGDVLAFAAAGAWSVYSIVVTRRNAEGVDAILMTRRVFFWALVFMLPLVAWGATDAGRAFADGMFATDFGWSRNAARFVKPLNLVNLTFLGLLASAACFAAWNAACRLLGTVRVSTGLYSLPVITFVFAGLFLGEQLTLIGAFGAVLTILGVILSARQKRWA